MSELKSCRRAALLALATLLSKTLESVLSSFSHLDTLHSEEQSFS